MNILRLREEFASKLAEQKDISSELTLIHQLVESVNYNEEQYKALLNVATRHVSKLNVLGDELFVISQLLEVHNTHETMESDNVLH